MPTKNSIKFIKTYPFIYQNNELNATEILMYSYFYGLNQAGKTIFASDPFLCVAFNKSGRTIRRSLMNLEKIGWITRMKDKKGQRIICINNVPE